MEFRAITHWAALHHYEAINHGDKYTLSLTLTLTREQLEAVRGRELSVTIEPVQTREERLREARIRELNKTWSGTRQHPMELLAIIERVDAEFAKENP